MVEALKPPPALSAFWHWWTSELKAMVPERLTTRNKPARAAIVVGRDFVAVERVQGVDGERLVDARSIEALDDDAWAHLHGLLSDARTVVQLEEPDVFVSRFWLPRAAKNRLRAAVALQLPQIAPLDPELLCWDARIGDRRGDQIEVIVAMARTARVEAIARAFDEHDVQSPPFTALVDGTPMTLVASGFEEVSDETRRDRRATLIAGAIAATIPFSTMVGASLKNSDLERRVQILENATQARLAQDRLWKRDEAVRQALNPLYQQLTATETVEELAKLMPVTGTALAIKKGPDKTINLALSVSQAEEVNKAISISTLLRGLTLTGQQQGPEGRAILNYRVSAQ